jgi:hypothetical protein
MKDYNDNSARGNNPEEIQMSARSKGASTGRSVNAINKTVTKRNTN